MSTFRGIAATCAIALNTLVCVLLLMPFAAMKLAIPIAAVVKRIDRVLNAIAALWIRNNGRLIADTHYDVRGLDGLRRDRWYFVVVNHQSWADIIVLQQVLAGRIPMLKFFLKRELMWVPIIGFAWWALDFPFMKRYSQEFLREHPERRGDDLEAIRRSCEKFALIPTAVVNFLEGTRYTAGKAAEEQSPFRRLLRPRSGGAGLALTVMGERFDAILDVTIFYPARVPSFFDLLAGRMREVVLDVRQRPIDAGLAGGNYETDPLFRDRVRDFVAFMWSEKDALLEQFERDERNTQLS